MEPLEHFSPSSKTAWEAPRYLQVFQTTVSWLSSSLFPGKLSIPSPHYPPFPALIVLLLEASKTHQLKPLHRNVGKWELSCSASQGVWLLAFELNQRGLIQQVLYWRVRGKTKQNTVKQQPTCTNSRWIPPLLGNELLKQMANIPFSFRPKSLSVAGFKDMKSQSSNTSLQSDSGSGRRSSWSRLDPWRVELLPLPLTHGLFYLGHPQKHHLPSWRAKDFPTASLSHALARTAEAKPAAP